MFETPGKLLLGLVTGIVFGFLLQKGRVAKFDVIVGQFLFKDWTVVKMMGTAVVVGAVGVWGLVSAEQASLHIKPLLLAGVLLGALLFGIGMALLGYCPGTCVAATGEGRRDAIAGLLGMLGGALLFVVFFDELQPAIQGLGNWGEMTIPQATNTSPWLWVGLLVAAGLAGLLFDRTRPTDRNARSNSFAAPPAPHTR